MSFIRAPPEWGIEPVPEELRKLRHFDIAVLWSSLGVGLLVMQAGALLVQWLNLSVIEAIIISIVGSIIGSLILAVAGIIGGKYGVPTMVSLRPIMGLKGSYLLTFLNVIQLIGWTTFEFIVMGDAATAITGEFLGSYTKYFWITIVAIWCYLMATLGPLAVVREWLEKFAIWIVYLSSIWITLNITSVISFSPQQFSGSISALLLGLDLVVAMPISWMPLIADYNRFNRSSREGVIGTFIGYTIANTWFYSMGACLAYVYPGESVVYSIALIYLGVLAILGILVDETDNAFADIYSSAVSLQNIFQKTRQWKLALFVTVISLILAYTIPIAEYESFLLLIGASFIPIFGIMMGDALIIRKLNYDVTEFYEKAPSIKWSAVFSWIIGFTVYYLLSYVFVDLSIGASIPTLIISLLIYVLIEKARR